MSRTTRAAPEASPRNAEQFAKHVNVRAAAVAVGLSVLAACGGHGSVVPISQSASTASRQSDRPLDLGRRASKETASIVVVLRYRDQAGLDRFVGQLARSQSSRYLTRQQFLARYAPTPQQEQHVVDVLRAAGFTIDRRYANRSIIDATARVRTVERFFNTQLHNFRQSGRGVRFASVKPAVVPSRLASLVSLVSIDTVVHARVAQSQDAPASLPVAFPPAPDEAQSAQPDASTGNLIKNPGFETGHLNPWISCSSKGVPAAKISKVAASGKYSAAMGTTKAPEINGVAVVCQFVRIPPNAVLTAFVLRQTNDTDKKNASQFVSLYNGQGQFVATLYSSLANTKSWSKVTLHLEKFSGQQDYLAFGVSGSKKDKKKFVAMNVDDVSLTGELVTPSPSPSPSPLPSPNPTDVPCPTATAVPTPNFGLDEGWGPAAETGGVLLPSIHCHYGLGETAAVIIDAAPSMSDIDTFVQAFGITLGGTISTRPVNGGASNPPVLDYNEGEEDVETIASLAPNANVIVYDMPDLSDASIIDAYNAVLSDGKADVVSSSFGGCDTDTTGDVATNQAAEQGAAEGMTFAASSGDGGSNCEGTAVLGTNAPASDPYFVSVGGTQSTSSHVSNSCPSQNLPVTGIANPVVWNDCVGAGGGGLSQAWPRPSYQDAVTTSSQRSVPDISMPAAGVSGYDSSLYGWAAFWGTSWSAPFYAAMQLEVNEACGKNMWGIPTLYGAFALPNPYQYDFYDVTSGNDDSGGQATFYTAAANFDTASGMGIPLGANLAVDECGGDAVRRAARIRPRR